MDDVQYRRAASRVLDEAVDMTQTQCGRIAGLVLGLHGVTPDAAQAFWRELSPPDQLVLRRELFTRPDEATPT